MKDRNGKTLRKGDVCVVHPNGEFVEFRFPSWCNKGHAFCWDCDDPCKVVSRETTWPIPTNLEKIGDVR